MILDKYCDYLDSYIRSFNALYKEKDKIQFFYSIGLIYSSFMELWIKFCIMNVDGFVEEYTIKELDIGTHDFYSLLSDEQTRNEFLSVGVLEKDYEALLQGIKSTISKIGNTQCSFVFRYPTDKINNIYMLELEDNKKIELIEEMNKTIKISCRILVDHMEGVVKDLTIRADLLKDFLECSK